MSKTEEGAEDVLRTFNEVRLFFLNHPDVRCVPLLLNSFGEGDGHGIYQLVEDTIAIYPEEIVVPALIKSLSSPYQSVRAWNAEIAANYTGLELVEPLQQLLVHGSTDESHAAANALALNGTSSAIIELANALNSNIDDDLKEHIRECLGM